MTAKTKSLLLWAGVAAGVAVLFVMHKTKPAATATSATPTPPSTPFTGGKDFGDRLHAWLG